jgi:hypothetical protein
MSDPGSENNGIANMHTMMRHQLDPSLHDTLQHLFCRDKKNIKSEIGWSQFRAQWYGNRTWTDPNLVNDQWSMIND